MEKTTHIALVSCPGYSHLVAIVELSKRLVQLHPNFHVTCIIPTIGPPPNNSKAYLQTLPPNINSIFLPPINKQDLPQVSNPAIILQLTVALSLPSLHEVLKSLSSQAPLAALVADFFALEALNFANEFDTLSYIYFPVAAMVLSLLFHIPKLDEKISGEYRDMTEPVQIPGCVPIMGPDLPASLQNRSSEDYKQFLEHAKGLSSVNGILINTFIEMESGTLRALAEEGAGNACIYPVGPITQKGSTIEEDGLECLTWLDNQPHSSVLYVSFGSGGALSQDQVNELALGLELSGQKFLWVFRAPRDSASDGYIGAANEDPLPFLPSGFLERTKVQGLVVPLWTPQVQVLSHRSVGGFLSHCGWSSILESVQEGEEGKMIRKRMKDLQDAAVNAIKQDGSSTLTLSLLAEKWENLGGI
ncbi:hypothetical protein RIF29_29910 [Crotalaria pallida]|uniref:Glycosyltransferase n=1 Tax=Crotalaria pallida TaxID=3830 RepID=A0AAN9EHI3_CROPI